MNSAMDLEERDITLADVLRIVRRRRKAMRNAVLVTLGITLLVTLLWPPYYRSTATILIEEQEIPQDLVRSTITSYANQQIQVITQRIMTLSNIMDIVHKYHLYDEAELRRTPRTEIMEDFRKDMHLDVVSADVIDPRFGRPMQATIAFTLAFDHRHPGTAQKVTSELVNLYLNENLKTRTEKSATTSRFLRQEAELLRQQLGELESQLAAFKKNNEGALPELYQYNMSVIERTTSELNDARVRLAELEKRKLELHASMVQLSPYAPTVLQTGESVLSEPDRLRAIQSEYRAKSSQYSDDHPDVVRLRREITSLEQALGASTAEEDYVRQLDAERGKLANLEKIYTADHPEVVKQRRVVESLVEGRTADQFGTAIPQPDNPAYVVLDTQLKSAEAESRLLQKRVAELQERIERFEGYVARTPEVEKAYADLVREMQNTTAKYREIRAKQMEAELAQSLEENRKGERFTLIEPPILPEEPHSPNRVAIVLAGIVVAIIAAAATAAVQEMLDESVRDVSYLSELLGSAPLATVPYITIAAEEIRTDHRRRLWLGALGTVMAAALLIVHLAIKPLDVIWFIALRKLGIG